MNWKENLEKNPVDLEIFYQSLEFRLEIFSCRFSDLTLKTPLEQYPNSRHFI